MVYADIRRDFQGMGVKRQWGCRKRQFSAFSLAIFGTLEMRPALFHNDNMSSAFQWSQCVCDFLLVDSRSLLGDVWSTILDNRPWMTLNGYFAMNSVFAPVWLDPTVRLSKNNSVKTNKDRHIINYNYCRRGAILGSSAVSGNIRLVRIFTRGLWR